MADSGPGLPQGTVTFLFTDIEGSTALARQLRADWGRVRNEHHHVLRRAIERHGGHEIDTAGDGFFVVFERAGAAVAAAVDAQRAFQESGTVRVRMGVHSAEPFLDETGYHGLGVHRAARICAAGHGGQILVSNATAGIVEDLGSDVELVDLGEHLLKDIERPQRLFQLVVDGLPTQFPPLQTAERERSRPAIATLLITDIAGWGAVLRTLGDEVATTAARAYHELVLEVVRAESGRELDVAGDTVLALFERPRDAVHAAVRIRDALRSEQWFPGPEVPGVAMAIHSGRLVDPTARHLGTVAFRCVTLCDGAEPGQILVSHATEALLEGDGADISLRDLGERTLPNLDHAVHVYEVTD
jgi:class 3 adenylate cyclase